MKVALFIPMDKRVKEKEAFIPIGIAYINSALRAAGISVSAHNLNYIDNVYLFLKELLAQKDISCVLSGGTSYNYNALRYIFNTVKSIDKSIITIGGGAGYTSHPLLFAKMTEVDCAVLGEGEVGIIELLRAIESGADLNNVEGIV